MKTNKISETQLILSKQCLKKNINSPQYHFGIAIKI